MTYWTILKIFYTGKKIPSLLVINNQPITDFREKANFLNLYFAKQCTPIENDSSILMRQIVCVMLQFWQLTLRTKIFKKSFRL